MFEHTTVSRAVLLCLAGFATTTAWAQTTDPSKELQRVQVTGSHILSFNAESPAPVQVITAEEIAKTGATNVQDFLDTNPAFGSPALGRTNTNFLTSGAGQATVNLRNLGDSRTLVLVNGRRFVSGIPGDQAVDLNMIPTDFIDRIEIMTGGASSTYGSDAVAGVVNIILKRKFDGFAFNVGYGQTGKNDAKEKKVSATFGASLPDGRGSLMAHVALSRQGLARSADHGASTDNYSLGLLDGDTTHLFDIQSPYYSSYSPNGRFNFTGANGTRYSKTVDANGNPINFSTNGPAGDGVGATGFNRQAYRLLAVPVDRMLLATKGEFQISEKHSAFFEANWAHSRSSAEIEPLALASSTIFPASGGVIPLTSVINGATVYNPYTPAWMQSTGATSYSFTRRMSDLGPRTYTMDNDVFRLLAGVKGELYKSWSYEAYASYGVTKQNQSGTGQVNVVNFANALQVVPGANGPQCANAIAAALGCVPANVFGPNTLSPAAAAYISAPTSMDARVTQKFVGANISGEAFNLPAGPVGIAFGGEWRKETSSQVWDQLTQLGLNAGNATPSTAGHYQVSEIYAEAKIPLLANITAVKSLDGTLAFRHGDYSTVGATNSWNVGLDWAVNEMLRFRATESLSTRAPNIGELYQGANQTFPSGVTDPCIGVRATDTSPIATNCLRDPGVAANVAANGKFTLTQGDIQGISGYVGGNPALQAEKGHSFTFGAVITPKQITFLDKTALTIDYFDIKVDHAINTVDDNYILNQCYLAGNAGYCQFVQRYATGNASVSPGAIRYLNQNPVNSGGTGIRGIDVTAAYADRVGPGRLGANFSYTHLLDFWLIPADGAPQQNLKGNIGAATDRFGLALDYSWGNWSFGGKMNYIGRSHLDETWMDANGVPYDDGKVPSVTYFNGQVSYGFGKGGQIYFGIDNVFDRKAPTIPGGIPGNTTGTNTAADVYDALGRKYYVGLRYTF